MCGAAVAVVVIVAAPVTILPVLVSIIELFFLKFYTNITFAF